MEQKRWSKTSGAKEVEQKVEKWWNCEVRGYCLGKTVKKEIEDL